MMRDALTWERSGGDVKEFRDYLVLALSRSGVCVTLQDQQDDYVFIANLPDCWNADRARTARDVEIFGPDLAARLAEAKAAVLSGEQQTKLQATAGRDRHFEFIVERVDRNGRTLVMTTIVELTEERRRERVLRTLLREVSHRSKNLLAIILSIASQTARNARTLPAFLHVFHGRVYALARAQDLITDSSWLGARLSDLVHAQAARYSEAQPGFLTVSGADPMLTPNEALHIGLALHELFVNAVLDGEGAGILPTVTVDCAAMPDGDGTKVKIQWRQQGRSRSEDLEDEDGGDRVFRSAVLERVTPAAVDGTATYFESDDGIEYTLTFVHPRNGP